MEHSPETQDNRAWHGWIRAAAFVLGGFAFLYVGVTFWFGRSMWGGHSIWKLLGLRELPLVIGLVAMGVCLRAVRFYYYGRRLGWKVPPWPSFVVFVASFSLTATPGKAGELLKSALLRTRYGTSVSEITFSCAWLSWDCSALRRARLVTPCCNGRHVMNGSGPSPSV
jgi:hypothetical protein